LRASIGWSVELLSKADRGVLQRLAVFRSPFTREAALVVAASCGDGTDLPSSLDRLVDASLLQLDDGSERYRMLETVRQFCAATVSPTDERALRSAHAAYYATWCNEVGDGLRGIEEQRFSLEMPDVVEALAWARTNDRSLALQICVGLASVWSALARTAATTATWDWLMSFDRESGRDAEWAAAVAALMSWATSQRLSFDGLAEEVGRALPVDAGRARGWVERGAGMVPAYGGHMRRIVEYTEAVAARGDDLELSVYGGFTAYMLAVAGRVPESDHWLEQLRRLTRRHRTSFVVETIGNGYAAAILVEAVRGDLRTATKRSECATPTSSLFAVTAASALGQAALWAAHHDAMRRAVEWVGRPTVPLLAYTASQVACAAALLDGDLDRAADSAEDFVELATRVPVGLAHGWPVCQQALLAVGRTAVARRTTDTIAAIVDRAEPMPYGRAALHLALAQDGVHRHEPEVVRHHAVELLRIARPCGFELYVVDALELVAFAGVWSGSSQEATAIVAATDVRREELGYGYRAVPRPPIDAPDSDRRCTLDGAIGLALARSS
jgi:hypothetical protein